MLFYFLLAKEMFGIRIRIINFFYIIFLSETLEVNVIFGHIFVLCIFVFIILKKAKRRRWDEERTECGGVSRLLVCCCALM